MKSLYGLRFIMVSVLFLFHVGYPIGGSGSVCVSFFLILSGFVLAYSSCIKENHFDINNTIWC